MPLRYLKLTTLYPYTYCQRLLLLSVFAMEVNLNKETRQQYISFDIMNSKLFDFALVKKMECKFRV